MRTAAVLLVVAERLDVPLLIHVSGGGGAAGFRILKGHSEMLEDVLVRHPHLRLYFENAGWPYLDEAIALMHHYPQVYADLSTVTWIVPRRVPRVPLRTDASRSWETTHVWL